MRAIRDTVKDIAGNIREAREKINRAYETMEENRALSPPTAFTEKDAEGPYRHIMGA